MQHTIQLTMTTDALRELLGEYAITKARAENPPGVAKLEAELADAQRTIRHNCNVMDVLIKDKVRLLCELKAARKPALNVGESSQPVEMLTIRRMCTEEVTIPDKATTVDAVGWLAKSHRERGQLLASMGAKLDTAREQITMLERDGAENREDLTAIHAALAPCFDGGEAPNSLVAMARDVAEMVANQKRERLDAYPQKVRPGIWEWWCAGSKWATGKFKRGDAGCTVFQYENGLIAGRDTFTAGDYFVKVSL